MLKKVLAIPLTICIVLSTFASLTIIYETKALPGPTVLIDPTEVMIPYEASKYVTVGVSNFTGLYGFQFRIWWLKDVINYTTHVWRASPWPNPLPIGPQFSENATHRSAIFAIVPLPGAPPASYSGMWPFIDIYWRCLVPDQNSSLIFDRVDTLLQDEFSIIIPIGSIIDGYAVNYVNTLTIEDVEWTPTSPPPYVESNITRANEPVLVTANVSTTTGEVGEVANVQLSYRVDSSAWYNTTMSYNVTSGLWEGIISGQLGDSTVEFFLIAHDIFHSTNSTSIIAYDVQLLLEGDLDGDGDVDIFDIVRAAGNYGKTLP